MSSESETLHLALLKDTKRFCFGGFFLNTQDLISIRVMMFRVIQMCLQNTYLQWKHKIYEDFKFPFIFRQCI